MKLLSKPSEDFLSKELFIFGVEGTWVTQAAEVFKMHPAVQIPTFFLLLFDFLNILIFISYKLMLFFFKFGLKQQIKTMDIIQHY